MTKLPKVIRKPSVLIALVTAAVLLGIVIVVVLVVARRPDSGEAQFKSRADFNHTETFSTDAFKDVDFTTADWNTAVGELRLTTTAGAYYRADRITLGFNNVSSNAGVSGSPTVVADAADRPVIAWYDTSFGNNEILVSRWNGVTWTKASGIDADSNPATFEADNISGNTGNSFVPSIAMDSADRPVVAWYDNTTGNNETMVSRWNGTTWTKASGIDADSNPATFEADNVSANAGSQTRPLLALDTLDRPVVSWSDITPGNFEVLVSRWNGTTWTKASGIDADSNPATFEADTITATPTSSVVFSVKLDSSDRPVVVWYDNASGNFEILVSRWNGVTWTKASGIDADSNPATFEADNVSANAGNGFNQSLAIDSADRPVVAWHDNTFGAVNEILVSRWNGSTWTGAAGIDADSNPATFESDNVSANAGSSSNPFIGLNSLDQPTVTWFDISPGNNEILLSRFNGTTWTDAAGIDADSNPATFEADNVSANAGSSNNPTFEFDSWDQPIISWQDNTTGVNEVLFTRWVEPFSSPSTGQSLAIDTTLDDIVTATLSAEINLNGGTATFFLSNDGGANWEAVTLGTPHTFITTGSDLRWRVELTGNPADQSVSPRITSLSIDYTTEGVVVLPPIPPSQEMTLIRLEGDDPVELAITTSQARFAETGSADAVILARADVMSDAFAITPYANLKNASLLLTPSDSVPATVMDELNRVLGPTGSGKIVYLAGGLEALTQQIETSLTTAGHARQVRFPGENRRETARLIANQIMQENPVPVSQIFVSEDQAFIDTLGLGSIAGQKIGGSVRPILLTQRDVATPDVSLLTFLEEHPSIISLEIAGGSAAVPYEVGPLIQQQYPQIVTLERSEGANRFETNRVLNNKHYPDPTIAVVANGESSSIPGSQTVSAASTSGGLFSALLAGNFAAGQSAPLLITTRDVLPVPTEAYLTDHASNIETVYLVGSVSLISQAVEDAIVAIFN